MCKYGRIIKNWKWFGNLFFGLIICCEIKNIVFGKRGERNEISFFIMWMVVICYEIESIVIRKGEKRNEDSFYIMWMLDKSCRKL